MQDEAAWPGSISSIRSVLLAGSATDQMNQINQTDRMDQNDQ